MLITPTNPFKWRHYPGGVILLCVRWYLRYPLSYEHVSELFAERGVAVDPSCIWRCRARAGDDAHWLLAIDLHNCEAGACPSR